ncbi:MAG: DUF4349 domain-containing protein [Acidimicrobiales bacterium]
MPTLDDEFLVTLLHEVGDSFTIPPAGPPAILGRVHRDDDERAGRRRGAGGVGRVGEAVEGADPGEPAPPPARTARRTVRSTVRSHRVLAVAAAVLVLLVAAGGAVVLGSGAPKANRFGNAAPATASPRSGFGVAHTPAGTKAAGSTSTGSTSTGSTSAGSGAAVSAPSLAAPTTSSAGTTSKGTATYGTTSNGALSQSAAVPGADSIGQPARIEQTGSLDLRVARGAVSATVDRLDALAGANNGFVATSQTHSGTSGGAPNGTVTLEVPVASFSAVLEGAESLGKVSQLTTNATDVTAQYADLQSQITALEASRQQYLTIMTRASSIGDVLAVQAQLDSLQSQIQQLQGQLAVLGSETDYSKLTIGVSETAAPPHHRAAAAAPSGLAKAWHDSVHGFVAGAEGLIRIAGPALFALLCLGAALLGGQLFWRRLQRRHL